MSCLSDLKLDQHIRGEPAEGVAEHVAGCERCRARLKQLEEARAAFLAENPRLRARRPWGLMAATAGLAAAAGLALLLSAPEGERLKGGPQLSLFVRHAERVRPAGPREPVSPGDRLQFTYTSDRPRHLAVLSLDGAGKGSVYFPDGDRASPIAAGRDVALPNSTILDTVLGPETLYGLFCDKDVQLVPLRTELEQARRLTAPKGCSLITLSIEKK
jgi:hypothetical protein